jgi:hypothetical protein
VPALTVPGPVRSWVHVLMPASCGYDTSMAGWEAQECRPLPAAGTGRDFRLDPVTRLFDLPAPEQSFTVRAGGRQCGVQLMNLAPRPGQEAGICFRLYK